MKPMERSPRPQATCGWCRLPLEVGGSSRRRFCSRKCRQSAFRLRRRSRTLEATDRPLRFAYADPPYPGLARKYYGSEEVDHPAMIASLSAEYDGWALSTSARALRDLLPLCPESARVCPWVKPIGASPRTFGIHNTWEPLIVVPGRSERPGVRDWLSAQPARNGGDLPGRKPVAFCAWLFELLGMRAGDELVDLFPGTGIVARSWRELSSSGSRCDGRSGTEATERRPSTFATDASPVSTESGRGLSPSRPGDSRRPAPAASDGRPEQLELLSSGYPADAVAQDLSDEVSA